MILSARHSSLLHHTRNFLLIALSLALLPLSVLLVLLARPLRLLSLAQLPSPKPRTRRNGRQFRVLVTGVSMAKGLFLCRAFRLGGCHVVAADFQKRASVPCGRLSRAVSKFYSVPSSAAVGMEAYAAAMTQIVEAEQIDLFVTCSGVATAVEDARAAALIEERTACRAFQLCEQAVRCLDDKMAFMRMTDEFGLAGPKWVALRSREEIDSVVEELQRRQKEEGVGLFIAKNVGMDDASRGAIPILDAARPDDVRAVLAGLDYKGQSWLVQEYLATGGEYCTHAVVVDGRVKAFTACASASVLMHYELLSPDSPQYQAMLSFTQQYARGLHEKNGTATGHLSFDFRVRDCDAATPPELVPIECNPRCHTATVLFRGFETQLTEAYLAALEEGGEHSGERVEVDEMRAGSFYWVAHDLVTLLVLPLWRVDVFRPRLWLLNILRSVKELAEHLLAWKDPTFEWWDPAPWLVLNHVYWPLELLAASVHGTKWKQINVSTGKMFKC